MKKQRATDPGPTPRRGYQMTKRAEDAEATRTRVLEVTYALWLEATYDEITLTRVAELAGVTKQTVLRLFKSKDGLVRAVAEWQQPRELDVRAVTAGDVSAAIAALMKRYEETGDANLRALELERRVPVLAEVLERARQSHKAWVEQTFAPHLPTKGAARERRVMAFYAATDVTVWKLLRRDFNHSARATTTVIEQLVRALVDEHKHER